MGELGIYILIFIICLLLSAFFSTSETAFTSSSRIRLKTARDNGNAKANIALSLLDQFDQLLSAILIGNNFVNILASSVATLFFVNLNERYGATIATIVSTILILLFAEITPKQIARIAPEKIAINLAPLLRITKLILSPFVWLFAQWQKLVHALIKVENDEGISEQELKTYVDEARRGGGIEQEEHRLIHTAIEFDDIEVKTILKPRVEVTAFDIQKANEDRIRSLFKDSPYSRPIVYEGEIDHVIGLLTYRDFHHYCQVKEQNKGQEIGLENFIQDVLFVPPMVKLDQLLKKMQKKSIHTAVVVDEYGGMMGTVSLEDLIEVLVGNIWEEKDEVGTEGIRILEEGKSYEVSGRYPVHHLFRELNLNPEIISKASTVSGFLSEQFERIPLAGDSFTYQNYSFTVTDAQDNRINEVLIQKN